MVKIRRLYVRNRWEELPLFVDNTESPAAVRTVVIVGFRVMG